MIRVDQARVRVPAILAPGGKGADETTKAIRFYADLMAQPDPGPRPKSFEFEAYGHKEVREALTRLFFRKCAYCESIYAATQPVDVEHWRPKRGVKPWDGPGRSWGYYWLAADWSNLLASCIDCNREREHVIEPEMTRKVLGKGNRFPLAPGSFRATRDGDDVNHEVPLLLNPYTDDPSRALELGPKGVLRARLENGAPHPKGEASIEGYALNRTELVQERQALLLRMDHHVNLVRRLSHLLADDDLPEHLRDVVEDLLSHEMDALQRFGDEDQPYSFVARERLQAFKAEMGGDPALA